MNKVLLQNLPKMTSNVEIKAKIQDIKSFIQKTAVLANSSVTELIQEDTYFNVEHGRLKLRETTGGPTELVHYVRPDTHGPKLSNYTKQIFENSEVAGLKKILKNSLGIKGIVKKKRNLFMVGQTRVHIDDVELLGNFMELEVMMQNGQSIEEGLDIARKLMQQLNVKKDDLLSGSYIDFLK